MANPLFQAMNGGKQNAGIIQQFPRFMQQMKGKNPQAIINELVSSGRINQQQLDAVQRQAQQMSGMFDQFKGMFG